ncbi:hypothetical protein IJG14_02670 [bacterium]|nr:hypothetical protein [bacterium]
MYYFRQISPIGCLLWTFLFAWLFFKLKLYYVLGIIVLIAIIYNFYKKTRVKIKEYKEEKEKNFEPEIGEVYKVCPYCGKDVKRSARLCPHCKNLLE